MEAKAYLEQVMMLNEIIANKKWELEQMRHAAQGMTSYSETVVVNGEEYAMDKVQSSGSLHRMEDTIVNYLDAAKILEAEVVRCELRKQEIISTIQTLPHAEYRLLHMVYVRGMEVKDAAAECSRSNSWGKDIHRKGLNHLQRILDKREEQI